MNPVSLIQSISHGKADIPVIKHRYKLVGFCLLLITLSWVTFFVKGFTFGIDFKGGTQFNFPSHAGITTNEVTNVFTSTLNKKPDSVQTVGSGSTQSIVIKSASLTTQEDSNLQLALYKKFLPIGKDGKPSMSSISYSDVSSSWGSDITKKAGIALVVFLVIVVIYIIIRFEWEMALAALGSLIFDLSVTAGVYSLLGFEVSPSTIVGLLTIMGFSLYDTVVVFDKVRENTENITKFKGTNYLSQVNLSLNQTLMRSINTSIISILPIISLLFVAVFMLGVGTLKDLGMIQLVGILVGTFSSIVLAAPLLALIKERRPEIVKHAKREERRGRIVYDNGAQV